MAPSSFPDSPVPSSEPVPGGGARTGGGVGEGRPGEADPELLGLPDPPRGTRTLTFALLLVTAVVTALVGATLLGTARYALAGGPARDLGELGALAPAELARAAGPRDAHVRASGALGLGGGIRYERPFTAGSFRLMPVAGRADVFVELHVPAGAEGARYAPPTRFEGRLVRLADAGPKHRGLASALAATSGAPPADGAWLLVDGETPDGARWALALVALLFGCAAWNVAAAARLVRRIR